MNGFSKKWHNIVWALRVDYLWNRESHSKNAKKTLCAILVWAFNCFTNLNLSLHMEQHILFRESGHRPLWDFQLLLQGKCFPHCWQVKCFLYKPRERLRDACSSWLFSTNFLSQCIHVNRFSPTWNRLWRLNYCLFIYCIPHSLQENCFRPCFLQGWLCKNVTHVNSSLHSGQMYLGTFFGVLLLFLAFSVHLLLESLVGLEVDILAQIWAELSDCSAVPDFYFLIRIIICGRKFSLQSNSSVFNNKVALWNYFIFFGFACVVNDCMAFQQLFIKFCT